MNERETDRLHDDAIRRFFAAQPEQAPERAVNAAIDRLRATDQPRMVVLRLPFPLAAAVALVAVILVGGLLLRAGLAPVPPGTVASPSPSAVPSTGTCSLEIAVGGRWPIVLGRGFAPNADVLLEIDRADGTHITIEAAERPELHTDNQGRFGLTLQAYPGDLGRNLIVAIAGCTTSVESIVTADMLPAPCPDLSAGSVELRDGPAYRAAVAADRPINWWHLDDASPSGASDVVGTADGAWVGAPEAVGSGADGGAVFLDGDESYVQVPPLELADFTIEAWVYLCDVVDSADALVGNAETWPNVNFHEAQLRLFTEGGDVVIAETGATLAAWQHWAVTRDETGTRIYLDGVLDSTGAAWEGQIVVDQIGRGNAGTLRGLLDEVAIYDRALTADQIAAHANAR